MKMKKKNVEKLESQCWEEIRLSFINTEESENDSMDIDDNEIASRTKLNDEKVVMKQDKLEEEENIYKEAKQKQDMEKKEDEKKRKRQMSIEKKRNKKKSRKMVKMVNEKNTKDIDSKYSKLFSDEGLQLEHYCLFTAKGDENCGGNCAALHFHHDETLGPYVRNNVNDHLLKHWPFYQPFVTFPFTQRTGMKEEPFKNEEEYLKFLKQNPKAAKLWMGYQDLQAVANMYQVPVHILTTGVEGMVEPRARWTHIQPDSRLKAFCKVIGDLPELWLFHIDEAHFNLIIRKNSELAKEGSIEQRKVNHEEELKGSPDDDKNEKTEEGTKEEKTVGPGGPGYMGWEIPEDQDEKDTKGNPVFEEKLKEVKKSLQRSRRQSVHMYS
jgi:hypothetical protein